MASADTATVGGGEDGGRGFGDDDARWNIRGEGNNGDDGSGDGVRASAAADDAALDVHWWNNAVAAPNGDQSLRAAAGRGTGGREWRTLPDEDRIHVDVLGTGLAGSASLLPLRIEGTARDGAPQAESALEGGGTSPGSLRRRMMNRLMFRTAVLRGSFPRRGRIRDYDDFFDFFDLFDASALSLPPMDARRPDRLVCPTCMRAHMPVEGTERILIPAEEDEEEDHDDIIVGGGGRGDDGGERHRPNNRPGVDQVGVINLTVEDDEDDNDENDDDDDDGEDSSRESTLPPLLSDVSFDDDNFSTYAPFLSPITQEISVDMSDPTAGAGRQVVGGSTSRNFGSSTSADDTMTPPSRPPPSAPLLPWSVPSRCDVPVSAEPDFVSPADAAIGASVNSSNPLDLEEVSSHWTTTDDDDDGDNDDDDYADAYVSFSQQQRRNLDLFVATANDIVGEVSPIRFAPHFNGDDDGDIDASSTTVLTQDAAADQSEGNTDAMEGNANVDAEDEGGSHDEGLGSDIANIQVHLPIGTVNVNDNVDEEDNQSNGGSSASSSSSSISPLIQRDLSSSSSDSESSMPPLIGRDELDSSSDSESSMPLLVPLSSEERHDGRVDSTFLNHMMFLPPIFAPTTHTLGNRSGSDRSSNPLTHLRDYGALRVYATTTCPICLDDHEPVVALQCGHCLCEDDFKRLGGYLASDKDKLKKLTPLPPSLLPTTSSTQAAHPDLGRWSSTVSTRFLTANYDDVEQTVRSTMMAATTIRLDHLALRSRNRESDGTVAQRRRRPYPRVTPRPQRGFGWAWGLTNRCDDPQCNLQDLNHRVLYSVNNTDGGDLLKHEVCFPLGSRCFPDGCGGVWILEEKRLDDTIDWPLWHKNKRGEIEKKFEVPRNVDLVADGNGGVWAITRPEWEDINNYVSEVKRYVAGNDGNVITHHKGYVPRGSKIYYAGGRGGKVWLFVEEEEVYSLDTVVEVLPPGMWLVGSQTMEKLGERSNRVELFTGDVDPDGTGGLWYLENDRTELDALMLKHCDHSGDKNSISFRFPSGSSAIHGCGSTNEVFVFVSGADAGCLTYISKDPISGWNSTVIGDTLPPDAKFASDGAGGLLALMADGEGESELWKVQGTEMAPLHRWRLPIWSTELVGG